VVMLGYFFVNVVREVYHSCKKFKQKKVNDKKNLSNQDD